MIDRLEHHQYFPSTHVQARHVDVWLPPSYSTDPDLRFGVLYMHDGQNLFDPEKSYIGVDWGIVPALEKLLAAGSVPEVIIVGIWSTGIRRREYMPGQPFDSPQGQTARRRLDPDYRNAPLSDAYLHFLVQELKPFIDHQYRTVTDRAHTTIMGSSMGGLVSLYALCQYPDVFSGAGCLSTHWPVVADVMQGYLARTLPAPGHHRIYFDYGTETLDAGYEPHQNQVDELMRAAGYTEGEDWVTHRFDGAEHSERAWRERVHIPLAFLLRHQPHNEEE